MKKVILTIAGTLLIGLSATFAQDTDNSKNKVQDTSATRSVPKKGESTERYNNDEKGRSVTESDSTKTREAKPDNSESGVGSTGTLGAPGSGYGTGNSSGSSPGATSGNSKSGSGKTSGTGSGSTSDGTSD